MPIFAGSGTVGERAGPNYDPVETRFPDPSLLFNMFSKSLFQQQTEHQILPEKSRFWRVSPTPNWSDRSDGAFALGPEPGT
jgi:hypothetical protein